MGSTVVSDCTRVEEPLDVSVRAVAVKGRNQWHTTYRDVGSSHPFDE